MTPTISTCIFLKPLRSCATDFFGDLDLAIIEVSDIQDDGTAVVGTGVGNVPTIARMAKKIIIELNEKLRHALHGLHDIYLPLDPPTVARYPSSR